MGETKSAAPPPLILSEFQFTPFAFAAHYVQRLASRLTHDTASESNLNPSMAPHVPHQSPPHHPRTRHSHRTSHPNETAPSPSEEEKHELPSPIDLYYYYSLFETVRQPWCVSLFCV
ncbi:Os02g0110650 [Oryza sativa Japonica Group]|jgi:hypothetical protein|uniref:Os02g0110650 protein n=1 Tax=Oryza sativa subsp. japonica TaxID=39947 RepID=A0A0P0VDZ3_ORYSJ|nr:hypothetical protein EE612_008369 [Oryza sativa]BAS76614.1 Os02g0110650 [Oryza sativa Japonica Group]